MSTYLRTKKALDPWLLGVITGLLIVSISVSTKSYILKYLFSENALQSFWMACFLGYVLCQSITMIGWIITNQCYEYYFNSIQSYFTQHIRSIVKKNDLVALSTVQSYRVMDTIRTLETAFQYIARFFVYRILYLFLYFSVTFFIIYFEHKVIAWTMLGASTLCIIISLCGELCIIPFLQEQHQSKAQINTMLFNTLNNISTQWYFFNNATKRESSKLKKLFHTRADHAKKFNILKYTQNLCIIISSSVILGVALFYYKKQALSFGSFYMIFFLNITLTDQIYRFVKKLRDFVLNLYEFSSSLKIVPKFNTRRVHALPYVHCGEIHLEQVSFHYPEEPWRIEDVTCTIPGRASCLITGPTGIGKSTLLKICAGLLKPQKGRVLIDGKNEAELTLDTLDNIISYIPKEPSILSETILTNLIPMPNESVSVEVMKGWCTYLRLDDWIKTLPDNYETFLASQDCLSFGQMQCITLLRGLGKKCPLIFLDCLEIQNPEIQRCAETLIKTETQGRTYVRTGYNTNGPWDLIIRLPERV